MHKCDWAHFPRDQDPSQLTRNVVTVFDEVADQIDSFCLGLDNNQVLERVAPGLKRLGFTPEVWVRCGPKNFRLDAWHEEARVVLEVEAGQAVENNKLYKHLFKACAMDAADGLIIAVRNVYNRRRNFEEVRKLLEALYTCGNFASGKLVLPLKEVVVIGY
jgi:hypothetical protein